MPSVKRKNKAIFFDRDGTINELVNGKGLISPKNFKLKEGIDLTIKLAKILDYLVIVISNQPSIAKGTQTYQQLRTINKKMIMQLPEIDAVYYCLHHPDPKQVKIKKYLKDCNCRKPKAGLLFQAKDDFNIDLSQSVMIGDKETDVQAGKTAGCKTILI